MIIILNFNIISIFLLLLNYSNNYIVVPFNSDKLKREKDYQGENDINFFFEKDKFFTLMPLGNDYLELILSLDYYNFYIGKGLCRNNSLSTYNPSNSKSFKNLSDYIHRVGNIQNASYSMDKCLLFKDIQLYENITFDNLPFLYGTNPFFKEIIDIDKICGIIGLRIEYNGASFTDLNFIKILKKNNFISSYTWSLIFFDGVLNNNTITNKYKLKKYEGVLICGIEEKNLKDLYSTEDIRTIKSKQIFNWGMMFSEIFFFDKNKNDKSNYHSRVQMIFDTNINYILCDKYFFDILQKTVFKPYFIQGICYINEKQKSKGNHIIICNKEFEKYMSSFPDLYFYSKEMNYTFILTSKELFCFYNNQINFLIIYQMYITGTWNFGNIFLKKYPFIFDYDKKTISFINIYNKEIKNKNSVSEGINIYKDILLKIKYISIIIGIIIGLLIGKKLWDKNRKKRANELIDSFIYESNQKKTYIKL